MDVSYVRADRTYVEFCSTEESQMKKRFSLDKILKRSIELERTLDFGNELPNNGHVLQYLSCRITID